MTNTESTPVRLATPADEASIMQLCAMLHEENGLFPMDEAKVAGWVHAIIHPQDGGVKGIIGVIGEPGNVEALIFLYVSSFWYAPEGVHHLEEFFAYVKPECRRSPHAKNLIKFAKLCSDRMGIPLMIGILSNHRTEAKVRLYERQLPKTGAFFFRRPGEN